MFVRIGMLMPETKLNGIIEMDESYFGGKARKNHSISDNNVSLAQTTLKRGRGTNKVSVVGMVQRQLFDDDTCLRVIVAKGYFIEFHQPMHKYMLFGKNYQKI